MNSSIINILEIFNIAQGLNSVGFSAGYNFDLHQADEFIQDLITNLKTNAPVFSGIMIIETSDENGNFTIIDGLQRITTINLLLCALCEGYKNTSAKNDESRQKIFSRYIVNEEYKEKLQLVGKDNDIFTKIVFSQELDDEEKESNLYKTYSFFLSKIKNREISATNLFKLVSRMQFMVIFSDKLTIPARELYQSLNGNKTDLSQINLITSFLNQRNEDATVDWQDLVNQYINLGFAAFLNSFVRDFLAIQNNGKIPSKTNLYKNFKNYYHSIEDFQSIQSIVQNLCKYARYYLKFLKADFEDEEIRNQILTINQNNGYDTYPYLMEVLDDFNNSHIEKSAFLDILLMMNSFIESREGNGEMNMNFASLSMELNKRLAMRQFETEENKITINEINQLATFDV